ncbi:MAG: putative outer membrane protein putative antigen [Betaproteobacteria bacterium]|nr:putative outer membrane protein putative antigen [Betaproteobacteria bacterium]
MLTNPIKFDLIKFAFAHLLLLFVATASAADVPVVGDEATFKFKLTVEAPSSLRDMLQNGLDLARWQSYESMTLSLLESLVTDAKAQALEAAATDGFFNAQAEVSIGEVERGMRTVRLKIVPGVAARVADTSIRLKPPDARAEARVGREWPLLSGQLFTQPAWNAAKKSAVDELSRERYFGAAVAESQATIDPVKNEANLSLVLDPGPAFGFGPVSVTGLKRYPAEIVTYLAPFKPGDPYSRQDVEVFLRRLNATNYFASSQVIVDGNRATASAAPVRVSVIEAPTRRLDAGVGYSTDTLYRASVAWRDVDVFDNAYRFHTELSVESRVQRLGATFELPTNAGGWNDTFESTASRTDIENLVTRGIVVGVTRRDIDERRQPAFGLSYYYEFQQPLDAPSDLARALFARYEYVWRTTDDLIFPRNGAIAALRLGAGLPGGSTQKFARAVGQLEWFHSFTRRDILALRGEVGKVFAATSQGIPQALLFRTGGDTTVRGYAYQSLGVQTGSAIVGGRNYALASAEMTHWMADSWGLAAFVDSGNATDSFSNFQFKTGYGAGVRVKSPIGPLRLDVARGQDAAKIRLHFSVGLAF